MGLGLNGLDPTDALGSVLSTIGVVQGPETTFSYMYTS